MHPTDRDAEPAGTGTGTGASRRRFLGGAAVAALGGALPLAAQARPREPADAPSPKPVAVVLDDATLLTTFMKLRNSTDGRLTIGWMDAVTHAFIEGETFPLYRLLAATWNRYEKQADDRYAGISLEVAFFLDPRTGELLQTLNMPRATAPVAVPLYRSGPGKAVVAVRAEARREFPMGREDQTFFRPGLALSSQYLSQAQRAGDLFSVREDVGTRVIPGDPALPGFFYREFGIWRGSWKALMDPHNACVTTEVIYSAAAAFRPWMNMGKTPGHTLQNGVGGKVQRAADLPERLLELVRTHQGDLLTQPEKVLAG
jgi:hypothetical protein